LSIEKQIGLRNKTAQSIFKTSHKNSNEEILNPKFCWSNFVVELIESIPYYQFVASLHATSPTNPSDFFLDELPQIKILANLLAFKFCTEKVQDLD
jgi:hypothetical protein